MKDFFDGITKKTVEITYTEEALGTQAQSESVFADYIASKAPDAKTMKEEIEEHGAEEVTRQGMTVFPRDEQGRPFMYDYQIRGFFKDSCGLLRKYSGTESAKLKAYKKAIDGGIFIVDRKNPIILPDGGKIGVCERPIRASTPMGERVALASSETVPAGSKMTFTVEMLDPEYEKALDEWLRYATRHGFGAWRNSGKGTCTYRYID